MWDEEEGRFDAIYDLAQPEPFSGRVRDIGCVNASIPSGLLTVYEATGDRITDYATAALDWVIEHGTAFEITPSASGHTSRNRLLRHASGGRRQAHAYEVTGRTNYLVYAIAVQTGSLIRWRIRLQDSK